MRLLILIPMKKFIYLQLIVILTLLSCNKHHDRFSKIVLNDSAYIKLTVLNCTDTIHLHYKTVPMFPIKCIINDLDITKDGTYYFSHKTTTPDFIDFTFKKRFQTYVIPGDTLKILCNLDPNMGENDAIRIEGVFGEIKNYFSGKYDSLGFWDIWSPLSEFSNVKYSLEETFSLADSLFKSEANFLHAYNKKNKLPVWFYEIMKANNEYTQGQFKPYAIFYRRFLFNEKIANPGKYNNFGKISIYNPKAKLSRVYYDFLSIYFSINHEEGLENKSGISNRALPLFERSIPEAKKFLKGDILEYYLAFRISDLFEGSSSLEDLQGVDSAFHKIKDHFTQPEIIEILEKQRDNQTEYLQSKKNKIPFTTTIFGTNK